MESTVVKSAKQALSTLQLGELSNCRPLSTFQHSSVAIVETDDGSTYVFKTAGEKKHIFEQVIRREANVYRNILQTLPERIAPTYVASSDGESPWLLIEDVSSSHARIEVPEKKPISRLVATLAKIHTVSKKIDVAPVYTRFSGRVYCSDGMPQVAPLLDQFLSSLPIPEGQVEAGLIKAILNSVDKLESLIQPRCEVVIHGEPQLLNALFSANDVLLIDWPSSVLGPGEIDVAMLLGLFTPNELRRAHEAKLIDDYLRHSSDHGRELDKSRFMEGYRLGLVYGLIHQINLSNIGLPPEIWSWMFRNIQRACIEHDVRELLD